MLAAALAVPSGKVLPVSPMEAALGLVSVELAWAGGSCYLWLQELL